MPEDATTQLHEPPKPGTDVMKALPAAAASGAAAGRIVAESMGLGGIWKVVGNLTAVAFVCGMFYIVLNNWMTIQKDIINNERVERQKDREARDKDREASNGEIRALTAEIKADRMSQREVTEIQRALVGELRTLVQSIRQDRESRMLMKGKDGKD